MSGQKQVLKIKRVHPSVTMPRYAHATDAGLDIYLPEDLVIKARERIRINLGFAIELPAETVGLILEKGSRGNEGLQIFGGVVDEAFRGEIKLVLMNTNDIEVSYSTGTPIAQLVIQPVLHPTIQEVEALSDSDRGDGAFGSTHAQKDGHWISTVKN